MEELFTEEMEIGGEMTKVIFDTGLSKSRTIRGTELKDTRHFLISEKIFDGGISVIRRDKKYKIAEVEENSVGFSTYFLEEWDESSRNYLDQN
jgi:hypothetical protein